MRGAEAVAHQEAPRKRDVGGRRGGREGKIGMICGPTSRRLPGKRDRGGNASGYHGQVDFGPVKKKLPKLGKHSRNILFFEPVKEKVTKTWETF